MDGGFWITENRLTVVVGHFGSGKTEFSVNLAVALGKLGHPFALADLDLVDPYFCSRTCEEVLRASGGRLIARSQRCFDADVPSVPPEVMTLLDNQELFGILDAGGDASGARVLARYRDALIRCGARVLCVVNGNRPLTHTPEQAAGYIRDIQQACGLAVTGLVNNTHLCGQTQLEDILEGDQLCRTLSAQLNIPLTCTAVPEHLSGQAAGLLPRVFPMKLYLKKPWELPLPEKEEI